MIILLKNKFYHLEPRKYFLKGGKRLIITFILFQSKGDFPVELFNEGVPKGVRQTPVSCNSATDSLTDCNLDHYFKEFVVTSWINCKKGTSAHRCSLNGLEIQQRCTQIVPNSFPYRSFSTGLHLQNGFMLFKLKLNKGIISSKPFLDMEKMQYPRPPLPLPVWRNRLHLLTSRRRHWYLRGNSG